MANVNGAIVDGEVTGWLHGPVEHWVEELTKLVTELRFDGLVLWADHDDPLGQTERFASRLCPGRYSCMCNYFSAGDTHMKLEGLHHLTMITGDAQRNVDFYAGVLGLRLVKKTVNFDSPDAYHLYFGDEAGSPGTILTWFEFPGAWRGRAGAGMIHTIQLCVASEAALDFWAERLKAERVGDSLFFEDYDGLRYELVVSDARRRGAPSTRRSRPSSRSPGSSARAPSAPPARTRC